MRGQPQEPCPTCRGFARIPVADGKQFACARCGTVLPPLPYGYQRGGGIPHFTPIRVGMKAQIHGKEFFAVGRICYTEKDDEGVVYKWEEWILLHPDGQMYYLEYDEGKWTLSEDWEPKETPERGKLNTVTDEGDMLHVDGRLCSVSGAGTCRVEAVEGEIPWPIAVGQPLRYVDLTSGDSFYSAEVPSGGGEVEWFRGRRLTDREVFTMFGLYDLLKALDKREAAQKGRRGFGLICLLAALIALIGWGFSKAQGRVVGKGSAVIGQITDEGTRFGPYRLNAVNRVYRLRVSSNLSQSAAWVQGVLETDTAGEFFNVDGDFWDESGYDSDGAWHEFNVQSSSDFRLSTPGEVYVRLYAEPDASAASSSQAIASFVIEEGVLHPTYLAWFGFTILFLGFSFLIASSPGAAGKVWQGMQSS